MPNQFFVASFLKLNVLNFLTTAPFDLQIASKTLSVPVASHRQASMDFVAHLKFLISLISWRGPVDYSRVSGSIPICHRRFVSSLPKVTPRLASPNSQWLASPPRTQLWCTLSQDVSTTLAFASALPLLATDAMAILELLVNKFWVVYMEN